MAGRRYCELLELATRWTTLYPNDWLGWLYRGQSFHLRGNARQAITEYTEALRHAPDLALVWLYHASAEVGLGEHRRALDLYRAALAREQDNPKALFGAALCEHALGNDAGHRAALADLLRQSPHHVPGLVLQGKLDQSAARLPQAIASFRKAATLPPWRRDALHDLAEALQANGEKDAAAQWRVKLEQVRVILRETARLKKELKSKLLSWVNSEECPL